MALHGIDISQVLDVDEQQRAGARHRVAVGLAGIGADVAQGGIEKGAAGKAGDRILADDLRGERAAIAERRSVWPVSRMRAACGTMLRALARNVAPSMRGMRMSEISTEMRSSRCSISSASAPLSAVSTS
jgi:hypothetical protein